MLSLALRCPVRIPARRAGPLGGREACAVGLGLDEEFATLHRRGVAPGYFAAPRKLVIRVNDRDRVPRTVSKRKDCQVEARNAADNQGVT